MRTRRAVIVDPSFDSEFLSLTGFSPMKWQRRLFQRFIEADLPGAQGIPTVCDIPTGLGKTSIIVIWLLALAHQVHRERVSLPRRLVYIVNRRTVVDQATRTVERLRSRLFEPDDFAWREHADTLKRIGSVLRRMCAAEQNFLGVSTLRGELADNEEWKADPARPAIVIGTIDMIGSKLLFSGYGDGRYARAHHAGLIGYDALIVHDEAHLTPAFSSLLHAVAQEQLREVARVEHSLGIARPVRVVELSATKRGPASHAFTLEPEDGDDRTVQERITASKRLYLHPIQSDSIPDKIVELSKLHSNSRSKVLIYVRAPEQAQEIASALAKALDGDADDRVALLTGTIRGYERDRLVESHPVYRALLDPDSSVEKSVYLVSTSAGEVGIDLDADHLVCDPTTVDALIQRLGRVNRRGGAAREARVDVVGSVNGAVDSEFHRAMAATQTLLEDWAANTPHDYIDVSPHSLRQLLAAISPERLQSAYSPSAPSPPLTEILLDNWSLTSIDRIVGRPEIAPFLHGLTLGPQETYVAWRREVSLLHDAGVDEAALRQWFRACRIEARERIRDRADRVKRILTDRLSHLRRLDRSIDFPVVLLDERGNASWSRLSDLAAKEADLAYLTVVLPVKLGGLDRRGMLDSKADPSANSYLDVAEHGATERRRERWLHRVSWDGDRFERLVSGDLTDSTPDELREKARFPLRQADEGGDEAQAADLVLLVSPVQSALENPETTSARQTLEGHTNAIVKHMTCIVDRLSIREPVRRALIAAALWHDKGKDRAVWQRYARNAGGTELFAKARSYLHPRALGGYRHEFGSLLDGMKDAQIRELPERDLVLHLISAHHGWSRPHFEPRSYDVTQITSENHEAAFEGMRRFGRLQERFGRWGLAWMESLLRCADIAASRQAAEATPASQFKEPVT